MATLSREVHSDWWQARRSVSAVAPVEGAESAHRGPAASPWRRALALDEHNGSAHNNLGLILYQQRRHAEARAELLRAIELDKTDARALVNLALLTSDLHEYENSVAYCERALSLDPSLAVCRRLIDVARGVQGRLANASQSGGFN